MLFQGLSFLTLIAMQTPAEVDVNIFENVCEINYNKYEHICVFIIVKLLCELRSRVVCYPKIKLNPRVLGFCFILCCA